MARLRKKEISKSPRAPLRKLSRPTLQSNTIIHISMILGGSNKTLSNSCEMPEAMISLPIC